MKGYFIFSDPFWTDLVPIYWPAYAALVPIELMLAVAVFRAIFNDRLRFVALILSSVALAIFLLGQISIYFIGYSSCYCFGNANVPVVLQTGSCIGLLLFSGWLLITSTSGIRRQMLVPFRLDVLLWSVVAFVSLVFFFRTDSGQVIAGIKAPSNLNFSLLSIETLPDVTNYVFEARNQSEQEITILSSQLSCSCVSTVNLPIHLGPLKKVPMAFSVKKVEGRGPRSEFVRFYTNSSRQIQVKLELPGR